MSDSKVSITITNRAPGLRPPVYVAGNFSKPEWMPEPMEYTTSDDDVYTFTKTLRVEPESQIVYKFRVGEGDWWLLNEDAPTVTDDAGNRNNVLQAPKAIIRDEPEQQSPEPTQTKLVEKHEPSTEDVPHHLDEHPDFEQPQPGSQVEALKHFDGVDSARSSTPEFIKTITEVSESAALLDRSTPEPGAPEAAAGKNEEQHPTTFWPNAADTAAEVADSAALLDRPAPEPEVEINATGKGEAAPSDVTVKIADTAAEVATRVHGEAPSEVAAQVADTAARLDGDESGTRQETPSPAYKTLTDVMADMKDESLDITGFSNDQEPVPLFAHECAGLYEDDEIPGVNEQGPSSSSSRPYEADKEDYDDPTLERFPSTRHEIMSTVRKVETGLNADQVYLEGVPISPIVHSRSSPTAEARTQLPMSDTSPNSRGQQHLPLPPSLTPMDERSLSTTSLQSIAEDAEGAEEDGVAEPRSEHIADMVEKSIGADETIETAKETESAPIEKSTTNEIAPVVEQAETEDEVIEAAQDVKGEEIKELTSTSGDLPVVVDVTAAVEDIASVVELPPAVHDIASVVELKTQFDDSTHPSTEPDTERVQQAEGKDMSALHGRAETENEAAVTLKTTDAETSLSAHKSALDSLVTVPSPLVKPSTGLLSPVSDDDEAVVVKSTKGKETSESGYLTPERASTPQPEEPESPREPALNTADPVAESGVEHSVLETEIEAPLPEPPSPQIVVSKPEETQTDKQLLPAAILDAARAESDDTNIELAHDSETFQHRQDSESEVSDASPKKIKVSNDIIAIKNIEVAAAAEAPLNTGSSEHVDPNHASKDSNVPRGIEDSAEVESLKNDEDHKAGTSYTDLEASANVERTLNMDPSTSDNSLQLSEANGAHEEESSEGVDTSDRIETSATVSGFHGVDSHSESAATTSATEENQTITLKQRSVPRPNPADRTNTPTSITGSHKEAAKGGNWFSAFLRLVFIDFFGGLVRKLYGGGRSPFVTTAIVLVAVGYGFLRASIETREQVVSY